jgi:hypothetical protein
MDLHDSVQWHRVKEGDRVEPMVHGVDMNVGDVEQQSTASHFG